MKNGKPVFKGGVLMNIRLTAFVLMAMFENLLILVQGLGWNYLNSKVLIYHVFIESNNTTLLPPKCILEEACPTPCTETEEWAEDRYEEDLYCLNKDMAPRKTAKDLVYMRRFQPHPLRPKCYCKPGHVRSDDNHQCIPESECPTCPSNESFKHGYVPDTFCHQGKPVPMTHVSNTIRCVCDYGFVRATAIPGAHCISYEDCHYGRIDKPEPKNNIPTYEEYKGASSDDDDEDSEHSIASAFAPRSALAAMVAKENAKEQKELKLPADVSEPPKKLTKYTSYNPVNNEQQYNKYESPLLRKLKSKTKPASIMYNGFSSEQEEGTLSEDGKTLSTGFIDSYSGASTGKHRKGSSNTQKLLQSTYNNDLDFSFNVPSNLASAETAAPINVLQPRRMGIMKPPAPVFNTYSAPSTSYSRQHNMHPLTNMYNSYASHSKPKNTNQIPQYAMEMREQRNLELLNKYSKKAPRTGWRSSSGWNYRA